MLYVVWLDLDSDPCRGGGSLLLVEYYVTYIYIVFNTMSGFDDE